LKNSKYYLIYKDIGDKIFFLMGKNIGKLDNKNNKFLKAN